MILALATVSPPADPVCGRILPPRPALRNRTAPGRRAAVRSRNRGRRAAGPSRRFAPSRPPERTSRRRSCWRAQPVECLGLNGRLLLRWGGLWASRDYQRTGEFNQRARASSRQLGASVPVARSMNAMGNWYLNQDEPSEAVRYHLEALSRYQSAGGFARGRRDTWPARTGECPGG
jgi:hypothetical protein